MGMRYIGLPWIVALHPSRCSVASMKCDLESLEGIVPLYYRDFPAAVRSTGCCAFVFDLPGQHLLAGGGSCN